LIVGEDSSLAQALLERLGAEGDRAFLNPHSGEGALPVRAVLLPGDVRLPADRSFDEVWILSVGAWPDRTEPGVRLIDLDPTQSAEEQAALVVEALCRPDRETVVAYRGDQRYVPRTSAIPALTEEKTAGPEVAPPDRAVLLAASPFERRALVEGYLRRELERLLGAPLSDEDMEMPVQSLGLDSLMAIQVRNRVETSLGVSLSLVDFLKGLQVRRLVDGIVEQLAAMAPVAATMNRPLVQERERTVAVRTEGVGSLSESELDSLLVTLLDQPQDAN
jgi:hypothetical protein